MRIEELNGKKVCILGFGKEGRATLEAIERYAPAADVTIADSSEKLEVSSYKLQTGKDYLKNLDRFDVLIKSPGIPPLPELQAVKDTLTTPTNIFLDSIEGTGAWVIGITGTKGKSTTTTLIYEILKAAKKDVHLVGNIGLPSIAHIGDAKKGTIFVLEMSSYQLMDATRSPHIAVVTSFFPEHLDYHGSLEEYLDAKKHIARFQKPEDVVIFQKDFHGAVDIAKDGEGCKIPFSGEDTPVPLSETKLIGEHNMSNIAAAFKVAELVGVPTKISLQVIRNFEGLPHRLQSLGTHHGIEWVDDAISTTPESATAAVNALGERVATIILGGQDRGLDFTEFGKFLAQTDIRHVILFSGSGPRIREAIEKAGAPDITFHDAASMQEAVAFAKKHTPKGMICLLSTASPSYGMFKNFEEKGERFKEEILKS